MLYQYKDVMATKKLLRSGEHPTYSSTKYKQRPPNLCFRFNPWTSMTGDD